MPVVAVVDGNLGVGQRLASALESTGVASWCVASAESALELLKTQPADLVIAASTQDMEVESFLNRLRNSPELGGLLLVAMANSTDLSDISPAVAEIVDLVLPQSEDSLAIVNRCRRSLNLPEADKLPSGDRMAALSDSVPAALFITDETGIVTKASLRAAGLLELPRLDVIWRPIAELFKLSDYLGRPRRRAPEVFSKALMCDEHMVVGTHSICT